MFPCFEIMKRLAKIKDFICFYILYWQLEVISFPKYLSPTHKIKPLQMHHDLSFTVVIPISPQICLNSPSSIQPLPAMSQRVKRSSSRPAISPHSDLAKDITTSVTPVTTSQCIHRPGEAKGKVYYSLKRQRNINRHTHVESINNFTHTNLS